MPERENQDLHALLAVTYGKALLVGLIVVMLAAGGWFWQQRKAEDIRKIQGERTNAAAVSQANASARSKLHMGYAKTPAGQLSIPIERAMEIVAKELK
jgi:hypothetical protein